MRIVVCVKHVPDIQSERVLDDEGYLERGLDDALNELDENAIEAAVSLAEEHDGEVLALTIGPEDAVDAVRRALQMGAVAGYHVEDESIAGSDAATTAKILAAAVRTIAAEAGPVDLVITGMASLDGLTSLVPAALAHHLDLPALTLAAEVELEGSTVRITRTVGDSIDVLEADLPLVLSVTDQANEARYPNFQAIAAARKRPVHTWDLGDLELDDDGVGRAAAHAQVRSAEQRPPRETGQVIRDTGAAGEQLANWLRERNLTP